MTNVNNFAIIGHLTADAEEFNIGNNTYVSFRVAVNRGQNKDASFIPVRAPKKFISDTLRAKLTKGASWHSSTAFPCPLRNSCTISCSTVLTRSRH